MKYRWFRNTHLFLGLFLILFLLMYGISAVQMAHPSWFDMSPTVTDSRVSVSTESPDDINAVAAHLTERHGFRGEVRQVQQTDRGYDFRIVRPGTVHEVSFFRDAGTADVRTHTAGFMGMLNRIHHIGGLHHEYGLLNVWGFFIGLASFGLMFIALTGLYMWFKTHRKRRTLGTIFLSISLGVSLTLMLLMRLAS